MRTIIRCAVGIIVLLLISSGCVLMMEEPKEVNLVRNGSFEEAKSDGLAAHWGYGVNRGEGEGARDFTMVKDGTVSFRISGISEDCLAQINQRLDGNDGLVADGTYRLRLWYRTEDVGLSTRNEPFTVPVVVRLRFRDANGQEIPATEDLILSDAPQHVVYYNNIHLGMLELATEEWEEFSVEFRTPANLDYMFLELFLWHTSGTVWFDDVRIVRID